MERFCPKCGGTVVLDDTYSTLPVIKEDNEIVRDCCGHCVKCKIGYNWTRIYYFSHETLLEED